MIWQHYDLRAIFLGVGVCLQAIVRLYTDVLTGGASNGTVTGL